MVMLGGTNKRDGRAEDIMYHNGIRNMKSFFHRLILKRAYINPKCVLDPVNG